MKLFLTQMDGENRWREGPPDGDIVARVMAGQTHLFEILMRRYNQRVFRAVRSLLKAESEVEEVMQRTYVEAFTHLDQLARGSRFPHWLVRIAINESLVWLRHQRHFVTTGLEAIGSWPKRSSEDPEEAASQLERARIIQAVLDQLPARYRVVFVLREIEGLSTRDTALALGISKDVVKTRLRRSKLLIRKRVGSRTYACRARALPFHATRCNRVVLAVLYRIIRLGMGGKIWPGGCAPLLGVASTRRWMLWSNETLRDCTEERSPASSRTSAESLIRTRHPPSQMR